MEDSQSHSKRLDALSMEATAAAAAVAEAAGPNLTVEEVMGRLLIADQKQQTPSSSSISGPPQFINGDIIDDDDDDDDGIGVPITCFTEVLNGVTVHFQIIRLPKQIYAWIGCNSVKLGHLHAAAPTRPCNNVSITSLLGGASDNTGFGIARRIVLKTGLNVILACNIPKDSPMLEADAENRLIQKLISLGYTSSKTKQSSSYKKAEGGTYA